MNLGAVSFAQIVKAAEPAFAALIGTVLYVRWPMPIPHDLSGIAHGPAHNCFVPATQSSRKLDTMLFTGQVRLDRQVAVPHPRDWRRLPRLDEGGAQM